MNDVSADREVLDYLRREGVVSVADLQSKLGVTATAVRQRLQRLMAEGLIERATRRHGRGRPSHGYSLTEKGRRLVGTNNGDLLEVLWQEVREIEDPEFRRGLLRRLAGRLAERYASEVGGSDIKGRMTAVANLMQQRNIPVEVDSSGSLPVLTAWACPYPELAQQDRSICAMERMLFSEMVGDGLRLTECRLDGANCCSFQPTASG